jgi:hypothetical protein
MNITKSVVRAMERVAPLRLAEKWDNVRKNIFLYVLKKIT